MAGRVFRFFLATGFAAIAFVSTRCAQAVPKVGLGLFCHFFMFFAALFRPLLGASRVDFL